MRVMVLIFLCTFTLSSCLPSRRPESVEAPVLRHLEAGNRFVADSSFENARDEYLSVVRDYSATSVYSDAVYKLALVHADPTVPIADDSVALHWFTVYQGLSGPAENHEKAAIYITLLQRFVEIRHEQQHYTDSLLSVIDSLSTHESYRTNELVMKTRRLQELESNLKNMTSELKRLREVDINLFKRGTRK